MTSRSRREASALGRGSSPLHIVADLALAVSRSEEMGEAIRVVLDRLLAETGWRYGEVWVPNEERHLELSPVWSGARPELEGLHAASRGMRFEPGQGLPGRVWKSRRPHWVKRLEQPRSFARAPLARELGLRSGLGVPVMAGRDVVGVLVFLDAMAWEDNQAASEVVIGVASLLGAPLARLRTEDALRRAKWSLEKEVEARTRALRESEAAQRAIVETAPDAIVTFDARGAITSFNPAAERLFGWRATDVIGADVLALTSDEQRARIARRLERYRSEGEAALVGREHEIVARRADGALFPARVAIGEARVGGERVLTAILRDLSEHKRLQREVVRSQRLAALGEMAAAMAHEVKNPLAAMSGALQILRKRTLDASSAQVIEDVLAQISRLDATVRKLGMLARPWSAKRGTHSLKALVERVSRSAARDVALAEVTIEIEVSAELRVYADAALLEQVIWNLALNAAQAMGSGTIVIGAVELEQRVLVSVRDNGPGIAPEVLGNLFKPFFTTKTDGSGLGLPICRSIVEAHEGTIEIESELGRGTTVTFELPAHGWE